jgi:hypothetical protein
VRETAWEWITGQSKGREVKSWKEATIFDVWRSVDPGIGEVEDTKKRLAGLKS